MEKRRIMLVVITAILLIFTGCSSSGDGGNETANNSQKEKASKHKYILATDEDFMLFEEFIERYKTDERYVELKKAAFESKWYYIGEAEYVEIPEKINGEEVLSVAGMFTDNTSIKGVKSNNPLLKDVSGMFQYIDLTDNGGVLDLTEFDFSEVAEAYRMFYGAKLDQILFGEKEFTELVGAEELFNRAEIKELDLSTLSFPKLTEISKMFYAYKGDYLNANIPSMPNLESVHILIGGPSNHPSEIKNLDINDIDFQNVSEIKEVFSYFTLGEESILDLSKWTFPNVPREERKSGSGLTYLELEGSLFSIHSTVNKLVVGEIDMSALEGTPTRKVDLISSPHIQKIKVRSEKEYEEYQDAIQDKKKDLEVVANDIARPEIFSSKEQWENQKKYYESTVQSVEKFIVEIAE